MVYAIVETGGKQYRVTEGDICRVEKLDAGEGAEVFFDRVLAVGGNGGVEVGNPYLEGARVSARILSHGKGKKIIVYKYKAKKNYRRKMGHRQLFTQVVIQKIERDSG